MENTLHDEEFRRNILTRQLEAGINVVIQTEKAAILENVTNPKAQFHYIVLPKADIANLFALTREHLPLLDHMMQLAIQFIEQLQLPLKYFRAGFKMNAFTNRLNMHVISDDFCSIHMRGHYQWNNFNTELFMSFRAVYALLRSEGNIEPITEEMEKTLRCAKPVQCNQCTFITGKFEKFKDHLYFHMMRRTKTCSAYRQSKTEPHKICPSTPKSSSNCLPIEHFQKPLENIPKLDM